MKLTRSGFSHCLSKPWTHRYVLGSVWLFTIYNCNLHMRKAISPGQNQPCAAHSFPKCHPTTGSGDESLCNHALPGWYGCPHAQSTGHNAELVVPASLSKLVLFPARFDLLLHCATLRLESFFNASLQAFCFILQQTVRFPVPQATSFLEASYTV